MCNIYHRVSVWSAGSPNVHKIVSRAHGGSQETVCIAIICWKRCIKLLSKLLEHIFIFFRSTTHVCCWVVSYNPPEWTSRTFCLLPSPTGKRLHQQETAQKQQKVLVEGIAFPSATKALQKCLLEQEKESFRASTKALGGKNVNRRSALRILAQVFSSRHNTAIMWLSFQWSGLMQSLLV